LEVDEANLFWKPPSLFPVGAERMSFCNMCGAQVPDGHKLCDACCVKIDEEFELVCGKVNV